MTNCPTDTSKSYPGCIGNELNDIEIKENDNPVEIRKKLKI